MLLVNIEVKREENSKKTIKIKGNMKVLFKKKPVVEGCISFHEIDQYHFFHPGIDAKNESESFQLGSLIKDLREIKKLTQEQVAEKCGITKAYISNVENNLEDLRLSTLCNIVENGLDANLQVLVQL